MKVRERIRNKRLATILAVTFLLSLLTGIVPVGAGDTLPADGQGERGANQPSVHGYRAQEFLNWNPATDPDAEFLRARVPLQPRIEAFPPTQANPNLNPETEMFNLTGDYGNAFFENYQYNDQYSLYLFNFWQYTDYYGAWHGMATESVPTELYQASDSWQYWFFEFGILNLPNPAYTNAAHKNGALSLATIFLPRNGQYHRDWIYMNPDGSMPMADKLIEVAQYFGFDGYFINQETAITVDEIPVFKQFMKYMRDRGLYIQWYDSVINTNGRVSYQRQFNNLNSPFVLDPVYGRVSDSIFIDYPWNASRALNSYNHALSLGLDPLETVYLGIEAGGDRFGPMRNDLRNNVDPATGFPMNSIAMLGAEFVYNGLDEDLGTNNPEQNNRAKPEYQPQVFQRERMWWSGPNQDPTNTGRLQPTGSYWDGVAHWITERSVIDSTFYTNFNTGHGLRYFVDGAVSNANEWSNINLQDVLPTWQWWITSTGDKLSVDFDYETAYQGGSSLVVSGVLNGSNDLRLYKTDIPVTPTTILSLTYNTGLDAGTPSNIKAALIFKDAPDVIEYVDVGITTTTGWNTAVLDLSTFTGRSLAVVGLNFSAAEPVAAYRANIGALKVIQGGEAVPPAPQGFTIDKVFDTTEMYVSWNLDGYDVVQKYHLYANLSNGSTVFLGGTYDDVYYIKSLYGETGAVELVLKAVGVDGTESQAATAVYDFAREARNIQVSQSGDLYFAGYLDVTWDAPIAGGDVTLELTLDNTIDSPLYTAVIPTGATSARLIVPVANHQRYSLRIANGAGSPGIHTTGFLSDYVKPEPYSGRYLFSGTSTTRSMTLDTPLAYDWWHLYTYANGVVRPGRLESPVNNVTYKVRGKSTLASSTSGTNAMDWRFADKTMVTIYLEDYRGNFSEPASTIVLFTPDAIVSTADMPDPVLRSAIEAQVGGLTYSQVAYYTGTVDLSGLNLTNITGLSLLKSAAEINLSGTPITAIPTGTFNGSLLRKLNLSNMPNLTVVEAAFTGTVFPAEIDITGSTNLTSLDLSNSSFEKITAGTPDQYPALAMVNLSNARFDLSAGTPEQQFLEGLTWAAINAEGQKPAAYLSPLAPPQTVVISTGAYNLDQLMKVVTARGTDYRMLVGAEFVSAELDVNRQIANLGLQVQITNPQGRLVDWIDISVPGVYQVAFRSLQTGEDLGTTSVQVIYSFSGFMPPVRMDRENSFKQGSTVPVKFALLNAQGQSVTNVSPAVYVAPVVNGVAGAEIAAVSANHAGNLARYDAKEGIYIFNLKTTSLARGVYQVRVDLGDGTWNTFLMTLR